MTCTIHIIMIILCELPLISADEKATRLSHISVTTLHSIFAKKAVRSLRAHIKTGGTESKLSKVPLWTRVTRMLQLPTQAQVPPTGFLFLHDAVVQRYHWGATTAILLTMQRASGKHPYTNTGLWGSVAPFHVRAQEHKRKLMPKLAALTHNKQSTHITGSKLCVPSVWPLGRCPKMKEDSSILSFSQ